MAAKNTKPRIFCAALVVFALLVTPLTCAGKKRHKGKRSGAVSAAKQFDRRMRKILTKNASDQEKLALRDVADALKPLEDGDSWSLEDGTHVLQPYSVGTTHLADALASRESPPALWGFLANAAQEAVVGGNSMEACDQLEAMFRRWYALPGLLRNASKEGKAGADSLAYVSLRGLEVVKCLRFRANDNTRGNGHVKCDLPGAWIACRGLADSTRPRGGNKHARELTAHDLELAVAPSLLQLATAVADLYQLDMTIRPSGTAERIREREEIVKAKVNLGTVSQEQHAAPTSAQPQHIDEVIVSAGALDKDWGDLSRDEREAAESLGYTETSFADVSPPVLVDWSELGEDRQRLALQLGWDFELWQNELEASRKEL